MSYAGVAALKRGLCPLFMASSAEVFSLVAISERSRRIARRTEHDPGLSRRADLVYRVGGRVDNVQRIKDLPDALSRERVHHRGIPYPRHLRAHSGLACGQVGLRAAQEALKGRLVQA